MRVSEVKLMDITTLVNVLENLSNKIYQCVNSDVLLDMEEMLNDYNMVRSEIIYRGHRLVELEGESKNEEKNYKS